MRIKEIDCYDQKCDLIPSDPFNFNKCISSTLKTIKEKRGSPYKIEPQEWQEIFGDASYKCMEKLKGNRKYLGDYEQIRDTLRLGENILKDPTQHRHGEPLTDQDIYDKRVSLEYLKDELDIKTVPLNENNEINVISKMGCSVYHPTPEEQKRDDEIRIRYPYFARKRTNKGRIICSGG